MKILIAPDKFKGALTANEVTDAIGEGIHLTKPETDIIKFPLADGGDGTAEILTSHTNGKKVSVEVHDPLFRRINSWYGISGDGKTAFIEMSAASGLRLLKEKEKDATLTTTIGTGELIRDAIEKGVTKIVLGIGGSATNDAGTGMASALGYRILDEENHELKPIGKNLGKIVNINDRDLCFDPQNLEVLVACDVDNPLYGENGAAYIYAPQKGATSSQVSMLDDGLKNFALVILKKYGIDISNFPGAGAAGGLGAGAMVFLHAKLEKGIKLVLDITEMEKYLSGVDLIITGEGKIDKQTFQGKVVDGVCELARKHQIPVILICGQSELDPETLKQHGVIQSYSLSDHFHSIDRAIKEGKMGLIELAKSFVSL